jgi:hypothetical protein
MANWRTVRNRGIQEEVIHEPCYIGNKRSGCNPCQHPG